MKRSFKDLRSNMSESAQSVAAEKTEELLNKHKGSSFDDFLENEAILQECETVAKVRINDMSIESTQP